VTARRGGALLHHRANSAQMLKVGAQVGRDATALESKSGVSRASSDSPMNDDSFLPPIQGSASNIVRQAPG